MTLIKALLQDQVLTLIETPVIASGGVEEDVVSFDFGIAAWDGYIKKAVFYRDESDVYHVDIGSDNTAVIPWEVLRQEGFMFLGVFGTKGSEIKTSTVARYRVENGAITTASELNPTPNIYADIIANTAARHSHGNKSVLDGITADDVAKWDETNCTTYIKVDSADDVISTVNGETYADIQALINDGKPVVVRFADVYDFYYFETFRFSDSSGVHIRLNFRCNMGGSVFTLTLKDDNTWAFSQKILQTSSITDSGGYFTSDTVEGALQEIGAKLAQEQLSGTTSELTPTQVYNAVSAGIPVKVQYTDSTYGLLTFTAFNSAETLYTIVSQAIVYYNSAYILAELFGNRTTNTWGFVATTLAQKTDIPTALKNPNALTIKVGDTTVTYDGSAAKTIEIADGTEVSY